MCLVQTGQPVRQQAERRLVRGQPVYHQRQHVLVLALAQQPGTNQRSAFEGEGFPCRLRAPGAGRSASPVSPDRSVSGRLTAASARTAGHGRPRGTPAATPRAGPPDRVPPAQARPGRTARSGGAAVWGERRRSRARTRSHVTRCAAVTGSQSPCAARASSGRTTITVITTSSPSRVVISDGEEPKFYTDGTGEMVQVVGVAGDHGGLMLDSGSDDDRVDDVGGPRRAAASPPRAPPDPADADIRGHAARLARRPSPRLRPGRGDAIFGAHTLRAPGWAYPVNRTDPQRVAGSAHRVSATVASRGNESWPDGRRRVRSAHRP